MVVPTGLTAATPKMDEGFDKFLCALKEDGALGSTASKGMNRHKDTTAAEAQFSIDGWSEDKEMDVPNTAATFRSPPYPYRRSSTDSHSCC